MHQSTTPSLSLTIWPKMGIKTVPHPPYSQDLAPCDFWLFPKLRDCRYETIEEMKEAVTKFIDTVTQGDFHGGLPEVGTVQKVHCSRRRLLWRGLEFHECTINKSGPYEKSQEMYRKDLVILITLRCFYQYEGYNPFPHLLLTST